MNLEPMHRHNDSELLALPDLSNQPKYIQWIVIAVTWALIGILVFGRGSRLADEITSAYEVIAGSSGIGFFFSVALCLAEWIIRSILHWKTNTHIAGTTWLPREIESKLFFLPFLRFFFTWFMILIMFGFFVTFPIHLFM